MAVNAIDKLQFYYLFGLVTRGFRPKKIVWPESIIVTTLRSPMYAMGWGC